MKGVFVRITNGLYHICDAYSQYKLMSKHVPMDEMKFPKKCEIGSAIKTSIWRPEDRQVKDLHGDAGHNEIDDDNVAQDGSDLSSHHTHWLAQNVNSGLEIAESDDECVPKKIF